MTLPTSQAPAMTLTLFLALFLALTACGSDVLVEGGAAPEDPQQPQIGDACVPAEEDEPAFGGFRLSEDTIETYADGDVCLVKSFQGRVSCPLGQAEPLVCDLPSDCPGAGSECTGGVCFDPEVDTPCFTPSGEVVTTRVCGACGDRPVESSVYRTCRCGLDDGQPADGAPLCDCPSGFSCELVRSYFGLGPSPTTGKYCLRPATIPGGDAACGSVQGYWDPQCSGLPESP